MKDTNPRVSIIILNWNGWEDTIECLESLYQITYPNYDVIVVDNGSEDESLEMIRKYCQGKIRVESKFFEYSKENKPIKVIEYAREEAEEGGGKEEEIRDIPSNKRLVIIKNEKNYGFAEGNNIGIRYAMKAFNPDYVLLLNNDTVVERGFLSELVNIAESDEKIGVVGPRIYFYDRPEIIQSIGVNINFWSGTTNSLGCKKTDSAIIRNVETIDVDCVIGACFLMKKEALTVIGLLDPIYFIYNEETDWSLRARMYGYKSICCLKAKIWHKDKASSSKNLEFSIYYPIRNRLLLLRRYARKLQFIFSSIFFSTLYLIVIIKKTKFKYIYIKYYLRGVIDGLFMLC